MKAELKGAFVCTIKKRPDLVTTDETIIAEIKLKHKKVFFLLSYRTPSKSTLLEIQQYCHNLASSVQKMKNENPSLIILSGDFNGRSPLFWDNESVENLPGKLLADFMLTNGLTQLINEPTHFPQPNIATCIDLILTDNEDSFVDSGKIFSPDSRCKHNITHGTINLGVPPTPSLSKAHLEI